MSEAESGGRTFEGWDRDPWFFRRLTRFREGGDDMAPVLVDVPFESSTLKAVVRQYVGIGTLNVKTARGEVKAQTTDIIMTLIERLNDANEVVPVDPERARDGFYTTVYPEDLFFALFPSAPVVEKMKAATQVAFDKDGEAIFMDAEGNITDYDGNEVMDTPENRARWSNVFEHAELIKKLAETTPPTEPPLPTTNPDLAGL